MVNATEVTEYTCRIVDGGNAPLFEIVAADRPDDVISAGSATGAWSQIFKTANKLRGRIHSNAVSGPDYYGFSQAVFKALIQELPGASSLTEYVRQIYVEVPPKGAAARRIEQQKALDEAVAVKLAAIEAARPITKSTLASVTNPFVDEHGRLPASITCDDVMDDYCSPSAYDSDANYRINFGADHDLDGYSFGPNDKGFPSPTGGSTGSHAMRSMSSLDGGWTSARTASHSPFASPSLNDYTQDSTYFSDNRHQYLTDQTTIKPTQLDSMSFADLEEADFGEL